MRKLFISVFCAYSFLGSIAQVNPQNGAATFSLPVFSWQDDKSRLSAIVALSYNSGNGLKVNEVASNVGQGWNLIAGGYISRMQAGEPDDQLPRDVNDLTKYPAGYLYDDFDATDGCPPDLTKYPIYPQMNKLYKPHNSISADRELDRFAFMINGRSGMFVLGKNNGDIGIVLSDEKLKVWYTRKEDIPNVRTTIEAFFIQDENGLIYKFTQYELTKVQSLKSVEKKNKKPLIAPELKPGKVYYETNLDDITVNPYIISGWHLTEIEDALTHRVLTISYQERTVNSLSGVMLQYNAGKNYSTITENISKSKSPDIYKITCPDGHEIVFTYGADRFDLTGGKILHAIDVIYDSRNVQRTELNSSYFLKNRMGIPLNNEQKKMARLALRSVKNYGIDLKSDDPAYVFDYYMGGSAADDFIPPAFSPYKDVFGYFNGNNSKEANGTVIPLTTATADLTNEQVKGLCYLKNGQTTIDVNPKNGYAKNGTLKKINYPSGASLEYQYSQNTVYTGGQTKTIGGVHVSKTIMRDGGNNIDCNENVIETNYAYTDAADHSSFWGYEEPVNGIYSEVHYAPERKRYKLFGCGSLLGCCKYKYKYPGILQREQAIDLTGKMKFMLAMEKVMNVVSLGLQVLDVIKLIFVSQGWAAILAVVVDVVFGVYLIIKTCFKDFSDDTGGSTYYNFDLKSSNPLPAQFSRVVVTEGSGGKGKTVMEFTGPGDYAIWEATNPVYSNKQRYAHWAYGLPKKTTVYSADNLVNPVKTIENEYDFTNAKRDITELYVEGEPEIFDTDYPSCKCDVKKSFSKRSDQWLTPDLNTSNFVKNMSSSAVLKADISTIWNGWVELKKTTEKNYKPGSPSDYLQTVTEYAYAKNHLPGEITVTQSNGDKNHKLLTYISDAYSYGSNAGKLMNLANQNMINIPFYSRETITKASDGLTYDLHETVTEFNLTGNGDIKPQFVREKRYGTPVQVSVPANYYQGPLSTAPVYPITQTLSYNDAGKLAAQQDEGGRTVAYIYDYNDKFVVAKIINQKHSPGKVAPSYTSFETVSTGGWQIGGTPQYTTSLHATGNRAFVLNAGNSLTPSFPDGGEHILSFWASSNSSIAINATSALMKTGPTINGLTYYEYNVLSNGSSPQYRITGNCTIDELRFYEKKARMQTSTFDPLIGKTSDCDENNRITYYEYDEKGRQRFIKDDVGNIIKMFEYNQAVKKPNPACSTGVVFTHPAISEVFIKECPHCDGEGCIKYEGSAVIYTIPAGTYTSAISQEVVDQLIQLDLETNGQDYANTNGICQKLYFNEEKDKKFQKEACEPGYEGSEVTYIVPAGTYSSTINQAAANQLAQEDIDANGQAYANDNGTCDYTTEPQWEGTGNTRCEVVNGSNTGLLQFELEDINPNSSSYLSTMWETSTEESTDCGGTPVNTIDVTYTNTGNTVATVTMVGSSNTYTFNLLPNTSTSTLAGVMFPGTYDITVSLPWGSTATTIQVYATTQTGGSFSQTGVTVPGAGSPPVIRVY